MNYTILLITLTTTSAIILENTNIVNAIACAKRMLRSEHAIAYVLCDDMLMHWEVRDA